MSQANLLDDSPKSDKWLLWLETELNVIRFFMAKAHHDPCPHVNVVEQKKRGFRWLFKKPFAHCAVWRKMRHLRKKYARIWLVHFVLLNLLE